MQNLISPEVKELHAAINPPVKDILKSKLLLKEGKVQWESLKTKKKEPLRLFLISSALVLTTPEKENEKYSMLAIIELKSSLKVPAVEAEGEFHVHAKKIVKFFADNEEEKKSWQIAIRFAQEGMQPPKFKEENGEQVWDPCGWLLPEEVTVLRTFEEKVKAIIAEKKYEQHISDWITDATLIRFLKARQFDIPKAIQMISDTFEWRSKMRPDIVKFSDVDGECLSGKIYVSNKKDRIMRPIVYMRPAREDKPAINPQRVKHMCWIVEEQSRKANARLTGVEKGVWLVDFSGKQQQKSDIKDSINISIEVIKAFQAHYPETLGKLVLLNSPALFKVIWSAVTPFIDSITQRKISFINKKEIANLTEFFDLENLETTWGGKLDNPWDFEAWKSTVADEKFFEESDAKAEAE